jgi:hypothetical protein
MTAGAVLIAVTVSCFDTSADTLASFSCAGAEHMHACTSPNHSPAAYYPQHEEYCFVRDDKGKIVKQGHYILWGVRGLKLEEGDYDRGVRVGMWTYTLPASARWERYEHGKVAARGTVAQPDSIAIDFCACKGETRHVATREGSTVFQTTQLGLDSCAVRAWNDPAPRTIPAAIYHVSRGLGWQAFAREPADRAFGPLEPYRRAESHVHVPMRTLYR